MNREQIIITVGAVILAYIIILVFTAKRIKEKNKKDNIFSMMLLIAVVLVLLFILEVMIAPFDRNGNRYDQFGDDMLYYSSDGQTYIGEYGKDIKHDYFVNIKNSDDTHSALTSYVNKQGYIFFDDKVVQIQKSTDDNYALYVDENGNDCYLAEDVTWNWMGLMNVSMTMEYFIKPPYGGEAILTGGFLGMLVFGCGPMIIASKKKITYKTYDEITLKTGILLFNIVPFAVCRWYVAAVVLIFANYWSSKLMLWQIYISEEAEKQGYIFLKSIPRNYLDEIREKASINMKEEKTVSKSRVLHIYKRSLCIEALMTGFFIFYTWITNSIL